MPQLLSNPPPIYPLSAIPAHTDTRTQTAACPAVTYNTASVRGHNVIGSHPPSTGQGKVGFSTYVSELGAHVIKWLQQRPFFSYVRSTEWSVWGGAALFDLRKWRNCDRVSSDAKPGCWTRRIGNDNEMDQGPERSGWRNERTNEGKNSKGWGCWIFDDGSE